MGELTERLKRGATNLYNKGKEVVTGQKAGAPNTSDIRSEWAKADKLKAQIAYSEEKAKYAERAARDKAKAEYLRTKQTNVSRPGMIQPSASPLSAFGNGFGNGGNAFGLLGGSFGNPLATPRQAYRQPARRRARVVYRSRPRTRVIYRTAPRRRRVKARYVPVRDNNPFNNF